MKSLVLILMFCLSVFVFLGVGCSNPSSQKITTGPSDPKLTYELVSKDVNTYKGKRVRWCGTQVSFESQGKSDSNEFITRATYMNTEKYSSFAGVNPEDIRHYVQ